MQEYVEELLEVALDTGLREFDFWEMTIGEITRHIASYNRTFRQREKERATYDYILASLIVRGVSITLGAKDNFPTMQEVYGGVFDEEYKAHKEKLEEKEKVLSVLRFKQFAQSYNEKYKNKVVAKSE